MCLWPRATNTRKQLKKVCAASSEAERVARRKKIPGLFLENQVRLHEELDAQPQPTRSHVVHLLADAVPQIQPQVLAFAAGELQPEVVHLDDA